MTESDVQNRPSRKDRLVALIGLLKDGKLHRAEDLARRTNVSTRSIYRDMDTLMKSGVPVEGARGVGYQMTQAVTLPPLNLSMKELEALHLGIAVMSEATDPSLSEAARMLAEKLDNALPESRVASATSWGLAVFPFADTAAGVVHMPAIRASMRNRKKIRIIYEEPDATLFESVVRPLSLDYWGRVWTCRAWCERSKELKTLRIDKIRQLTEMSADYKPDAAEHGSIGDVVNARPRKTQNTALDGS